MFNLQAYYTYRTASCQFDCNANEYWWWSTAAMTGLLKNRLRWDAMTSNIVQHFWSWRLAVYTRSEVKSEFKYYLPEVFKAKDPKMYALITVSIKFQGVEISGPSGYSKRKVPTKWSGKFYYNYYLRTRRRGTNCPPDHRMENTLAKGPASRGQMWSDCLFLNQLQTNVVILIFCFWNHRDGKEGKMLSGNFF